MPHGLLYGASFTNGVLSFTDKQGRTICNAHLSNYLTLTATSDNSSVALTKVGTLSNTYEVNTGSGWTAYEFDTVIPLNSGQSCKWRCSAHPTTQKDSNYVKFVMTGTIKASGNIHSMLSRVFENITSFSRYDGAFMNLFSGCTSLTQAPALPATSLSRNCYYWMFDGCTSLTQAPALPATSLSYDCYNGMFNGCRSLVNVPELPATTLADSCYSCMFQGCTSLTGAPALPSTTLAPHCYYYMFNGCTSLTKTPNLPAPELIGSCYRGMFQGCSNLNGVRIAATTTATYALDNWLSGVSATGDFYCDPNATIFPTDNTSGIPTGWTRHALADYPQT